MVLGMDDLPSVDLPRPGASPRDVTHLLKSNDIPLNSDIPFIQNIISNGQSRLDELNGQIESLQAKLAQLTRMRDETAESVRQYRSILHPVRCVPPEILCEIFALVTLSADENSMARATAPWRLGLICRSWRKAALSYPLLWCFITPHSFPALEMMETQLLRSSNTPLVVSWRGDRPVDSQFLAPVVVHCGRWRTLRLNSPFSCMLDWLLPATGRLAQLETLEMIISPFTRVRGLGVFSTAPALRQLVLTDREFKTASPQFDVLWAQITHYRGLYELDRQLEILKGASVLVECAVSTPGAYFHGQDMVLLPHLQRLDVDGSTILNHLEAPSLDTLSSRRTPGSSLGEHHLPFIQRSGCSLTKLVLTECGVNLELITLLQGLPALAYLRLEYLKHPYHWSSPEPQATLFDALTLTGTSEICPNLTSFLYGYWPATRGEGPEFFGSSFSRMAQSRSIEVHPAITQDPMSTRPSPLQFLRIFELAESRSPPPVDLMTSLETLRDGGVDAVFLNYSDSKDLRAQRDFFI